MYYRYGMKCTCILYTVVFRTHCTYCVCVLCNIFISLQVFGVVVNISDGILGITLLAWGNSIGGK